MEELRIPIEEPEYHNKPKEEKTEEKPKQTVIIIGTEESRDNVIDI